MMLGDWEIVIIDDMLRQKKRVYLTRVRADGAREFVCKNNTIIAIPEGEPLDKTEDYSVVDLTPQQLQTLANAIAEHGVRTTNDSKNEGLLEATKAHLEDMRTLVFEKKDKK